MAPISGYHPYLKNGFLLIELLTALAILSGLLLVITTQIWQCICWQQEVQLRLDALHAATATIDRVETMKKIKKTTTTENDITITIQPANIRIAQKKIDAVVPVIPSKMTELEKEKVKKQTFKPVIVTSEWTNAFGKTRRMQFLTGVLSS